MKPDIHPKFKETTISCACGAITKTMSSREDMKVEVCSKCHPFFTGEQRIVDSEGQVDRFYKKLQARKKYVEEKEARDAQRVSLDRPIAELELGTRAIDSLAKAEITMVGQVLEKLALGEKTLLDIDGFGRKSLADLKKRLRQFGYELPDAEIMV